MLEFSCIETVPVSTGSVDRKEVVNGVADEITTGINKLDLCKQKEYIRKKSAVEYVPCNEPPSKEFV